ncbi:hypothetical protein FACS1894147_07720 [Spirochaetia bacterium]|nr:hypothetical protein FACS1894147_07720 [Spirochaetia bacterium]
MNSRASSPIRPLVLQIVVLFFFLYAVCSTTALLLVLLLVPLLSLDPNFFVLCAALAFGTMVITGIYHVSNMFRRNRRKTDRELQSPAKTGFGGILAASNAVSRILFFVIVVYCLGAIAFAIPVFGTVSAFPELHLQPLPLLIFAVVSFAVTAFISIFHLSMMIRRRKRKTDM